MGLIYRTAGTITRKQPYIDWANGLDDNDGVTFDSGDDRPTTYLVTTSDLEETVDHVLGEWWPMIFEEELGAWDDNDDKWPSNRTRELFDSWFAASISDGVVDLAPEEPLTEEDVEQDALAHAMTTCAWCDLELDEGRGRVVGFPVPEDLIAHREGRAAVLLVDRDQTVTGVVPRADSDAKRHGEDLIFRVCTTRCAKGLTKAVSKALRRLKREVVAEIDATEP